MEHNSVIDAILSRRSVRSYKPDMVPAEIIEEIMKAGTYAASGRNLQTCIIIAVTNKDVRDRLSEINCKIGGWNEGFDPFYGAPVVLIVLGRKDYPNHVYDGSLVMANLMLAAHSLGIGSCWIHRAKEEFEMEEGKQMLKDLGIEGEYEGIGHCILGYPAAELPAAAPRKENWTYTIR